MEHFGSIFITILGILLFITFLPTLLWLLFLFLVMIFIFVLIQRHKLKKYEKEFQDTYESQYYETNATIHNDDVIDVEYSESDEDA